MSVTSYTLYLPVSLTKKIRTEAELCPRCSTRELKGKTTGLHVVLKFEAHQTNGWLSANVRAVCEHLWPKFLHYVPHC